MQETFRATLTPMLVMFLCMALGFIARKKNLVPENAAEVLSKLENYFFVPALILNTFMQYCTVASISQQYPLILYCTLVLAAAIALAFPLSRLFAKEAYQRSIYRYALSFANFSFMGNAIVPAILGEEMLYQYMLYILPLNLAVYTWGIMTLIPRGEKKQSFLKNLCNPIFLSILLGAVLGLSGLSEQIPGFIRTTISSCSACMGPLAMILTGLVVGSYDFFSLLKNKKIYLATLLRLVVLPMLFIGFLLLLRADKLVLVLTLFAFGTPLGLNTVVFPAAYGGYTSTGASMAMISHTLCVVTIPLLYALLEVLV